MSGSTGPKKTSRNRSSASQPQIARSILNTSAQPAVDVGPTDPEPVYAQRVNVNSKFILRGVEWLTSFIPKTETTAHSGLEGRECVANNIYIKAGECSWLDNATEKRCYWCRLVLPQNDQGVYQMRKLPLKELSKQNTFLAQGQFCCRECIKAFCIDNYLKQPDLYSKALAIVEMQHRKDTGSDEPLKEAPPWQFLEEYGGKWSSEQYQTNMLLGYTYTQNTSPVTNKLVEIPMSSYYREYS
jgi:hypothetical protein